MLKSYFVGLFLLGSISLPAQGGDELVLKNGDRLTGELLTIGKGKLEFKTGFAPKLVLDLPMVKTLSTAQMVDLVFTDGARKKGRLRLGEGFGKQESEGVFSFASLEAAGLELVNHPPPVVYKWDGSINAGYTANRGNTKSDMGNFQASVSRRWKKSRLGLDAIWLFQRTYDETAGAYEVEQRSSRLDAKYDIFLKDKIFSYINGRTETDKQQQLDIGYRIGCGLGYQLFEEEDLKFGGEVGFSYDERDFKGGTSNENVAFRIAEQLDIALGGGFTFLHTGELLTTTTGSREHRADVSFTIRASLTESFFAQLQLRYQWDTNPAPGVKRLDEQYLFSIGWSF